VVDDQKLTVEKIREAVKMLKAANPVFGYSEKLDPNRWYAYDEIEVPKLENKGINMEQKFKEIDEKIKKEWGK
jgi:hypothetical protein